MCPLANKTLLSLNLTFRRNEQGHADVSFVECLHRKSTVKNEPLVQGHAVENGSKTFPPEATVECFSIAGSVRYASVSGGYHDRSARYAPYNTTGLFQVVTGVRENA